MRYLVTGGAGFIGSYVVEELLRRGSDVVILDNLSTGRRSNVPDVADVSKVRFIQGSVLDPLLVDELVEDSDVVVHLAAAVGVKLIVEKPLRSFITNIKGSENILEAAHRYRKKVLLASTSEIYGKNLNGPFKEDDDRLLGSNKISRWGYSTSKAVDEILAFAYFRERGLPTVVVRLFNTVGPRQASTYGMVIPRLVEQALAGESLTVFGDGRQTRSFCHVRDVVKALLLLLEEQAAEGDVLNVGSSEEISILGLAELIIQESGSNSAIELVPYERAYESGFEDMMRRVPDTSKIERLTGWKATTSLREIVKEVVVERRGSTERA